MVETDIEAEVMCTVQGCVTSQLHDQVNPPQAPGDVGNNDSRQRTQPMTESFGTGMHH